VRLALRLGSLTAVSACAADPRPLADPQAWSADPASAHYEIDGAAVALDHGVFERPAAPGSASSVRTRIVGAPVSGDLDGDGDEDVVLWLSHQTGGSGTFYYVVAAYREEAGFRGTSAVLLGDRIAPGALAIEHRLVSARHLARGPSEAMAARPTIPTTTHLVAAARGLKRIVRSAPEVEVAHGWLVIGHEVREFRPCASRAPLWLLGSSPALAELQTTYQAALPDAPPYTQLFVTLTGRVTEQPRSGFGASYQGGFAATGLVNAARQGACTVTVDQ